MHQLAWVRLMVARHPWAYWLAIAVAAAVIGLSASQALAGVDASRRSWGRQQAVWIATTAIEPGDPIAAARREVPVAMVPLDALHDAPTGDVARQHLGPGEIVTNSDVVADGSAALVPDGWVAFAVVASVAHFAPGDHLAVFSGDQLVAAGVVADVGESELMVAVPSDAA
ncbi:MAG: SAF domain-containing protein, partial [Ilumatobacteraceae bacterium]